MNTNHVIKCTELDETAFQTLLRNCSASGNSIPDPHLETLIWISPDTSIPRLPSDLFKSGTRPFVL